MGKRKKARRKKARKKAAATPNRDKFIHISKYKTMQTYNCATATIAHTEIQNDANLKPLYWDNTAHRNTK